MTGHDFTLAGARLSARGSGALWWEDEALLAVADLHLGKAERVARRGGALLPPYDTDETLTRLADEIAALAPRRVLCLGDSFDDDAAARALPEPAARRLLALMAGRHWIWISGNHDPAPVAPGGSALAEAEIGPLWFRHIAIPGERNEISGHYHPKARLCLGGRRVSRPCFLIDHARAILPAFGTYTGGLASRDRVLEQLMGPEAVAVLTGPKPLAVPMRA
ncbi:ligase-associated DNA damage response endonuclease PdeM [Rhodovulum sp. MB263]|uniref:ligase-associated DNA damage response endonuclease PdeM n=1 Tax=Rhodovulum sp. (strain MB263) TaxID=308754 RepID=UPI0009B78608|nr:ligase-associated DNA damage response endonuclease PdeM [Rhodovulum sp. MB263]ARC87997.1 metallophosphoesterase [Rhodovulum sp. MB263]